MEDPVQNKTKHW